MSTESCTDGGTGTLLPNLAGVSLCFRTDYWEILLYQRTRDANGTGTQSIMPILVYGRYSSTQPYLLLNLRHCDEV